MTNQADLLTTLLKEIREAIFECEPFTDSQQLRALFIDPRISPWQNRIPTAGDSFQDLITRLISKLIDWKSIDGANALVQFLLVLSDHFDEEDFCHKKFHELAKSLDALRNKPIQDSGGPPVQRTISVSKIIDVIELRLTNSDLDWQLEVKNLANDRLKLVNVVFRPSVAISVSPGLVKFGPLNPNESIVFQKLVSIRADQSQFDDGFELAFELIYKTKQSSKRITTSVLLPLIKT